VPLLAATPDGLYRVARDGTTTEVLSTGVQQVRAGDDTAYAATTDGLFVSGDTGETWRQEGLAGTTVQSVTADGLAGSRPVGVFERAGPDDWQELDGLRALATKRGWPTASFRDEAWARSLARDGERLLVGVEVGGLALRDGAGNWHSVGPTEPDAEATNRCDDVHHVAVRNRDEWLLATGGGVHWTTDAGGSWTELGTGDRAYARELCCTNGDVYVATNASPPRWRPPDAAAWVGPPDDLERRSYPGAPGRFLISWAASADGVYAGANDGAVLRFDGAGADVVASVPVSEAARSASGVRSLAVV
jgi:hypothetical protein